MCSCGKEEREKRGRREEEDQAGDKIRSYQSTYNF